MKIDAIRYLDPVTGEILQTLPQLNIYPARHFVTPEEQLEIACQDIKDEFGNAIRRFEKKRKTPRSTAN